MAGAIVIVTSAISVAVRASRRRHDDRFCGHDWRTRHQNGRWCQHGGAVNHDHIRGHDGSGRDHDGTWGRHDRSIHVGVFIKDTLRIGTAKACDGSGEQDWQEKDRSHASSLRFVTKIDRDDFTSRSFHPPASEGSSSLVDLYSDVGRRFEAGRIKCAAHMRLAGSRAGYRPFRGRNLRFHRQWKPQRNRIGVQRL